MGLNSETRMFPNKARTAREAKRAAAVASWTARGGRDAPPRRGGDQAEQGRQGGEGARAHEALGRQEIERREEDEAAQPERAVPEVEPMDLERKAMKETPM